MKKLLMALMASTLLFGCDINKNSNNSNVSSASAQAPAKSSEVLKAALEKQIPGINKIDSINPSPINGIDEVVVGRKVFYVTQDGKYLIFGNIVDPVLKKSLTEARANELSKIDWNKLPLDLAIKHVNGTGARKIAVFADPDCPYCKLFEKQVVPQLKNTTIYTFLFPLPMHPNAKSDSAKVWCSKNRDQVWIGWMQNNIPLPTNENCDTSGLDKIMKVGTDIVQVDGTPTLVLSNGQLIPGMVPADQLITQMEQADGIKPANASSAK